MKRRLAPAKVNLCLHVTGLRSDGYHLLDSLVCFADFGDYVSLTPAAETVLTVTGPRAEGVPTDGRNLILKAHEFFGEAPEVAIELEKNLPAASGIGGGSADAAATLRLLSDLTGRPVVENTARLGADIPVCLQDNAVRMQGVGEVLTPIVGLPQMDAILVNPLKGVSTPEVFKALVHKKNAPMSHCPQGGSLSEFLNWLDQQRNDLEPIAKELVPEIEDVLDSLSAAALARMSGSGATCFGIYADRPSATKAAAKIAADHPGWWVQQVRLN
ncbi:4-(cytidine 5'-diphospho)-2-C-methyl-D-erythritol kinase [Algirhabdus cladophorae]|uniref:4-(cytidine 5'-diphospho)-2-C-methyl-D-erythritol kinase n=1 Tax=Algirhabdus cladophorae TaxID=3377108 RepID=UPI003B84B764